MAIKKVSFKFDPFKQVKVPKDKRTEALNEIKDFILESALDFIGEGKSPVKKGRWRKPLTKDYKDVKKTQSSVSFANLELEGDLLDDLKVTIKGEKLIYGIEGKQAGKADGNNRGTYGKKSPIKGGKFKREFIPKKGQTFKQSIWTGINNINREIKNAD